MSTAEAQAALPEGKLPPTPRRSQERTLRMVRSWRSWNRGMEAGFSPDLAALLVGKGLAIDITDGVERQPLQGRIVRKV